MSVRGAALNSLTGLRWWAAFGVFFFHMTAFAPVPIFPLFEFGHFGVMFFFVLSGFVLSWSWKRELPVRAFYMRRIGRIWPATMVALIIAIPVFYSFTPDPAQWWVKPFDLGILLLSVPVIQGWWLAPVILFSGNPAAWTLTCEFFFYSLHPVAQRLFSWWNAKTVLIALGLMFVAIVAIKASCFVSAGQGCIPLPLPIERLPEFLLGMGIGVLARQGKMLKLPTWIPLAALGFLFVFLAFGAQLGIAPGVMALSNLFANEATLLLMVVTIACVAQRDIAGKRSAFNSKWLIKLGELSFTFYLVHATVMYLFVALIGQLEVSWTNVVWYPLVLAAGLLVAYALHTWIEKPFEAKFRRLSDKIGARS